MKKSRINVKLLAIILIIVTAGGWWWSHSGGDKNANKKPAVAISVATAQKQDMPLTLRDVGTVVTYQSVAIRTRLDSQITKVNFHDGDYVNKGDLLFVLDERALKSQLAQEEANRTRDAAQLDNLRRQYERSKALAAKGYVAQADLDSAKAAYEAQKASVGASQASVENMRTQLEYARIVAPISGRTGTITITSGNTVKNNDQPLVIINQVKPIRVQVALPQRDLAMVREAMKRGAVEVEALPESGVKPARGTLEYIDNAVDQATGTFAARASFPNDDETLWPGMFVTLTLQLGDDKDVVTIPEVAVQHGQDGDYVFVIDKEKAVKRPLKIERMQDGHAIVSSGLQPGEQVAVDGILTLTDGSDVKIQQPDAKAEVKPESPKK